MSLRLTEPRMVAVARSGRQAQGCAPPPQVAEPRAKNRAVARPILGLAPAGPTLRVVQNRSRRFCARGALGRAGCPDPALSDQQDGFGTLQLFRLAVQHHHIAIAQHGIAGRLPPEYSLAAEARERHTDAAAANVTQCPAHRPGPRRDDHGLDLLAVLMALVERPRIAPADDVSED